ncbi:hypothetical protein SCALM49S_08919 [Streptomyces californicus]
MVRYPRTPAGRPQAPAPDDVHMTVVPCRLFSVLSTWRGT